MNIPTATTYQFYDSPKAYYDDHGPVRASAIKTYDPNCPEEYKAVHIDRCKPDKSSDALRLGSAVDILATTPEEAGCIHVWDERKTTDNKAFREAEAANPDKLLLLPDQHQRAMAMAAALHRNKRARGLLKGKGQSQVGVRWQINDWLDGKALFDRVCFGEPFWFADLKTTRCTSLDKIEKAILDFGYHRQLAWYCKAYEVVAGRMPDTVWLAFAFVSEHWPHVNKAYAEVHPVDTETLTLGYEDNEAALTEITLHLRSGNWDPPPREGYRFSLPEWYMRRRR